jgi:hypothetical protein
MLPVYSFVTIVADTKIVSSRSLPTNAVLPLGNKQQLILSTECVQLNGKVRLGGRTGNNAGWREAGVESAASPWRDFCRAGNTRYLTRYRNTTWTSIVSSS